MAAKFEIIDAEDGWYEWQLKAANGAVIARSAQTYAEKRRAERSVDSTIETVRKGLDNEDLQVVDLTEET